MSAQSRLLLLFVCCCAWSTACSAAPAIDFSKDIRPILSGHCFKCHGPDDKNRQGELRLDFRDFATGLADSGERAIIPGQPDASELIRRIESDDPDEQMPPPAAKKPLTAEEKAQLRAWIAAGAEYKDHWAYLPPKQLPLPQVRQSDWVRNPIDAWILSRLEAEGLSPAVEADRYTLARRVALDLIGLPPTPEQLERFVKSTAPDAYEQLVDELLASPHYGERWARKWLDLARYSDSNGYEKDRERSIWPYRDWVIRALSADMPFDQFTIEQLAGDLLPGPTIDQRIATGFHRNSMVNEEGGIDPLEFRFYAMTDRVATTSTTWMGLTMGCAQCHTHKYDTISHREYYQFMALLDNADEPRLPVPNDQVATARAKQQARIDRLRTELPDRYHPLPKCSWKIVEPSELVSAQEATLTHEGDGIVQVSGKDPERDDYALTFESETPNIQGVRLEVLHDAKHPKGGPGRTPHGNFVLTDISAWTAAPEKPDEKTRLKWVRAEADIEQSGYPVVDAIDKRKGSGWAIQIPGKWNVDRTAWFYLEKPVAAQGKTRWTIRLRQQFGGHHTIARFRLSLGEVIPSQVSPSDIAKRDRAELERKFEDWLAEQRKEAVAWQQLMPIAATANVPVLRILPDRSILATSDQTKRDVYDVDYKGDFHGVTALRIEALPDASLPGGGPGRIYYEGELGDFLLTNFEIRGDDQVLKLASAQASYWNDDHDGNALIDDDQQSGWSIEGGQGKPHCAVIKFAEPLGDLHCLHLQLACEKYHACAIGKFRISITRDPAAGPAHDWSEALETSLLKAASDLLPDQRSELFAYFLQTIPELSGARADIDKLVAEMPEYPSTLVFTERPADLPRKTQIHERGEFLRTAEDVSGDVPSILPRLPSDQPASRLALARWLVSPENPLTPRVIMNRQWAALFGKGIVRTLEDFGVQGDTPTHPELLDWLAVEFRNQHWSLKRMHRLMVTSATYRQASQASPAATQHDPANRWLSHANRIRLEGELVRDTLLQASGLLSSKIGGPPVFPPQPAGITTEIYTPFEWKTSTGDDRFRRGIYTFAKRTAPYAMFNTFDCPSGEACVPRRDVSDTPLQALTMLNDEVLLEAAQALGERAMQLSGEPEERASQLFARCLCRPASTAERAALVEFYRTQEAYYTEHSDALAELIGKDHDPSPARGAWTLVGRALLNLDEFITRN